MTDPLIDTIRAVLDELSPRAASGEYDGAFVLATLQAAGDALRCRVPLPPDLRRWLRTCREDVLAGALRPLPDERASWTLSETSARAPMLPFILRRRDEVESVRAALDWRAVTCPAGSELATARAALDAALLGFDVALSERVSRDEVDELLGERAAFDDRGWRSLLRGDASPGEEGHEPDAVAEPSAEVLDAWLHEGRMSRSVHRHAERDSEFAARLRTLVDEALHDAREDRTRPVGFVAQRWRQMQDGQRKRASVQVHALPPRRLAAATASTSALHLTVDLGRLAPLNASASIECDDRGTTLKVFADDALSRVTWGGVACEPPGQGGPWMVTLPLPSEPIPLVVTASDGTVVEFDVDLQPTTPAADS